MRTRLLLPVLLALSCGESASLDEIRELQRDGRYARTLEPLRQLVDEDVSNPEANLLLGTALLRTGQAGLAVWSLRRASESPEYAVEAGMLLTQAMLESRTSPDALAVIEKVLALEPENVEARGLHLQVQLALGRLDEALAEIDRILELDPDNLGVLVPRVTTLIAKGSIEEAETALEATREAFATTDREVSDEMRARMCVAQGMFRFEKGEREEARAQYEECLEQFPTDRLSVTESASFYDRIGQPERATEILERALEASGEGVFRVALARRLGALGRPEEEERLLREQAETQPSAPAWFMLADHYVQRERFDDALAAFEASLAASPAPPPMLRFAHADTLVQAGRFDEARRVARSLRQPELRNLILGRALLEEGDAAGALAAFEAGIRLWPNNAAGRFLAGQAAERIGSFPAAMSHYRESLRSGPALTQAGLALAELHAARGEREAAKAVLRRYVPAHPREPEGYLLAIRLAHDSGEHEAAANGLARLSRLPGQAAVAVAEEATLLAADKGAELGVEAVEASGLDLADPAHAPALGVLLSLLGELGEHPRALALVSSALEAHPEEARFHELHGLALRRSGAGPDPARRALERALEIDPGHAGALVALAELSADEGQRDAALRLYDRAAEAHPDDPAPQWAAARLAAELGDTGQAARRLERLLARHPRQAEAALELAALLAERGERRAALRLVDRAAWLGHAGADEARERIRGADVGDRAVAELPEQ